MKRFGRRCPPFCTLTPLQGLVLIGATVFKGGWIPGAAALVFRHRLPQKSHLKSYIMALTIKDSPAMQDI